MKKCFIIQQKLYVDLYYNDLISLKKSIRKFNNLKFDLHLLNLLITD